jgi:hypothetical protein
MISAFHTTVLEYGRDQKMIIYDTDYEEWYNTATGRYKYATCSFLIIVIAHKKWEKATESTTTINIKYYKMLQ